MKTIAGLFSGLLVASLGSTGMAALFAPGDIFVGGSGGASGQIFHYNSSGTLIETLLTGSGSEQTGMAFNASGSILYATSFQSSTMHRFSSVDGSIIAPNPFLTNDAGAHNESIVFDAAGNFYVGQADGTEDIIKRAADGTFLARYDVATTSRGSDWIDLAADQKTMYYTSEGREVKRFDISTGVQLPDFAALPGGGNAFALRLLGDGGLLVADRSNVKRLNSAGAVIQTYDVGGEDFFFALNLDPNGQDFWTAGITSGNVYRFDISSGALELTIDTPGSAQVTGLAIKGELTQAVPTGVPEPGTVLAGLAMLGISAAKRHRKTKAAA